MTEDELRQEMEKLRKARPDAFAVAYACATLPFNMTFPITMQGVSEFLAFCELRSKPGDTLQQCAVRFAIWMEVEHKKPANKKDDEVFQRSCELSNFLAKRMGEVKKAEGKA